VNTGIVRYNKSLFLYYERIPVKKVHHFHKELQVLSSSRICKHRAAAREYPLDVFLCVYILRQGG
jgi:hypothetical protein